MPLSGPAPGSPLRLHSTCVWNTAAHEPWRYSSHLTPISGGNCAGKPPREQMQGISVSGGNCAGKPPREQMQGISVVGSMMASGLLSLYKPLAL